MSQTKQKQVFLRKQIIEIGYEPTHFTEFLSDLRSDGDDVDNWSFDSLEEAVKKYQVENPLASEEESEESEEPVIKPVVVKKPTPIFAEDSSEDEQVPPPVKKKEKKKKSKKKVVVSSSSESDSSEEVVVKAKKKKKKKVKVKTPVESESEEVEIVENIPKKEPVVQESDSEAETIKTTKTKKSKKDKKSKKEKKDKKAKKEKKDKKKNKRSDVNTDSQIKKLTMQAKQYKESKTDYLDIIKTNEIIVPTAISKRKFRIIVSDPKQINKGVFSKFVVYKVQTRPLKFEVERRFSDFLWLRNYLVREFPALYVPPMAPKDGKHFGEYYLEKRMEMLQLFIDSIAEHPTFRCCQAFENFLKIGAEDKFTQAKSNMDNKMTLSSNFRERVSKKLSSKVQVSVENFIDKDGEVKVRISEENGEYGIAVDELNRAVLPLNEKLREHSNNLMKSLNEAAVHAKSLADTTQRLKQVHDEFNKKVEYSKTTINANIYNAMTICINSWSSHILDQGRTIENYLIKSFNWTQMEIEAHNELLKMRNQTGTTYYKQWGELEKQKDKLFGEGYSPMWEADFGKHDVEKKDVINNKDICKLIMLPRATEEVKNIQKIFGYLNVKMVEESDHLFQARAKRVIQSMTEFCKDQIEIIGGMTLIFKNYNTDICKIFAKLAKIQMLAQKSKTDNLMNK